MRKALYLSFIMTCISFLLAADSVREPKTGMIFDTEIEMEGEQLRLAGVGLRTKAIFKVAAAALYLDLSEYSPSCGKAGSELPQSFYDSIINSKAPKLLSTVFVRDVSSSRIRNAFEEGLMKAVDLDAPEVKKDAEVFLKWTEVNLKKGDAFQIFLNGEDITVLSPAGVSSGIRNKKLADGIVAIWLGKNAEAKTMKKSLVSFLCPQQPG